MPSQLAGAFASGSNAILLNNVCRNRSEQVVWETGGSDLLELVDFFENTLEANSSRVGSEITERGSLPPSFVVFLGYSVPAAN